MGGSIPGSTAFEDTADHRVQWGRNTLRERVRFSMWDISFNSEKISLCRPLPKRPFSTYNRSQIPLVSLICTSHPGKQIAVLVLRVKSLCYKLKRKLPFLYCAQLFFFIQPITWLHGEKISSSIISSVSCGQNYTVLHVRDPCGGWCPGMLWSFWCLRTYLSVPKLFDPSTEAAAILFSNIPAASQADNASPMWEGLQLSLV